MAPEVAKGEPYDHRVDSYSFGILFWQICSLQTPYAGFSTKMHGEKVVQQGHRPKPDPSWPFSWAEMMARSWTPIMTDRPEFDELAVFLDDQVEDLLNNDGEVPSRATDIKAKKRRKQTVAGRLDVDTRIHTDEDVTVKRFDQEIA
jgi:serine/threonine protein kinase